MERDGWVQREASPTDRRRFMIRPTDRGQEVWLRAVEWCREVRTQALTGFTPEEAKIMKTLCERIRRNLGDDSTVDSDSPLCTSTEDGPTPANNLMEAMA